MNSTTSTPATGSEARSQGLAARGVSNKRRRLLPFAVGAILAVVAITLPLSVADRFWLSIIITAGVLTIGGVAMNLLTGYLGEASLGHAFFMGIGAYVGIWVGETLEAPLLVWLPAVLLAGAIVGTVTGPLALRLRGGHFLMVTLALVFLGQWVFINWRSVTGGPAGRSVDLPLTVGPVDFDGLTIGGTTYSASQSFAVLVWMFCVIAILVVRNIALSRTGLAMRAIHDNELAASAAGVSLFRAKMGAFIVSSSLAALCGAFYAQQLGFLEPTSFNLLLSLQFLVLLIIGGSGTTIGPVIGAFFVAAVPLLLQKLDTLPFILGPSEDGFGFTGGEFANFLYALLFVLFLLFEPGGIARIVGRLGRGAQRLIHKRSNSQNGER